MTLGRSGLRNRNVSEDPERWDLGSLFSIFHEHENVFKNDFSIPYKQVIANLAQIKEMRNRRAHEISAVKHITAREAY